jgi:release factor glutamine methyltransferase
MAITVQGNNSASYFLKIFRQTLSNRYPQREIESIYRLVLADVLGWSYSSTLHLGDKRLSESEILKLHGALTKLSNGVPIQLVAGFTEFFDLKIQVNQHVLFPRPETEYLIHIIKNASKHTPCKVVDVCSGSGCISIALRSIFSSAEIVGLEKSEEALKIAKANSKTLNLPVIFHSVDVLQDVWPVEKIDLLVSNPPYIPYKELEDIDDHVWDNEPEMALMVPDENPLLFYDAILRKGREIMNENGQLYFEINPNFADELLSLGQDLGYISKLILDLENRNRFLHCVWPGK